MIARWSFAAATAMAVLAAPAAAQSPEQRQVEAAMADSAAGWNAGDVDRFMNVYARDASTSFVTKEGVLRGKAAMTARYKARYSFDDPAKRGVLTFKTLDFRRLGGVHALYIGQYLLTYPGGKTQTGPTSLVFVKQARGWKIIADHSS